MEIKDHPMVKAKQTLHELCDWLEENNFDERTKKKAFDALLIVCNLPDKAKKSKQNRDLSCGLYESRKPL